MAFYTNNNLHKNHYTNNYNRNHYKFKAKYIITACIPEITITKFFTFFLLNMRKSTSSINFNNKTKFKKVTFTTKIKKYSA